MPFIPKDSRDEIPKDAAEYSRSPSEVEALKLIAGGRNSDNGRDATRAPGPGEEWLRVKWAKAGGLLRAAEIDLAASDAGHLSFGEFPFLASLRIKNPNLRSIDLTKNGALASLEISCDGLPALDLSGNANLSRLVARSSKLAALDLSDIPGLAELFCYCPGLGRLDLAEGGLLKTLVIFEAEGLGSLDLSGSRHLVSLTVKYTRVQSLRLVDMAALEELDVDLRGNALSSVDLSEATSLTRLCVMDNKLAALDLTNNPALADLEANNNIITAIDLSKNTSLENLNIFKIN
jgi:hypothetical protein